MKRRVVVTGVGLACGGAKDLASFEHILFAGESPIRPVPELGCYGLAPFCAGVEDSLPLPPDDTEGRTRALLQRAAAGLLENAGLTPEAISQWGDCRLYLAMLEGRQGPARSALKEPEALAAGNTFPREVAELLGLQGPAWLASLACASGNVTVALAFEALRQGRAEAAVVAGADGLSPVTLATFQTVKAMSSGYASPFDKNRDGINVGEGAAMLLLEPLERAKARGAAIFGEILGAATGNEACHMTAPGPEGEGIRRMMEEALADAGLSPSDIGYIDAHGTGTKAGDGAEARAIASLFGKNIPVAATKAVLGHTMGAAGVLELVSVLLALRRQKYVPLPRLREPMTEELRLSGKSFPLSARYALSNSLGFSGSMGVLVLGGWEEDAL